MKEIKQCTRCVMDSTDPDIIFDENGVCNHCHAYDKWAETEIRTKEENEIILKNLVAKIKRFGRNKKYDCLIGISGGVDSSYVAYLAVELGLRPLLLHFDNGWNSETAVRNIENIVRKLKLDLVTYVIDWEEFRDLQRSFIEASVVDIEILTDHAQKAINLKTAKKYGIKYVLVGNNRATESPLPKSWRWNKFDLKNIKAIQKKFGTKKIKMYPKLTFFDWIMTLLPIGTIPVKILNYVDYNMADVKAKLSELFDWKDYGGKHFESIFTKFFQVFILPRKFNIDKRKAHLSSLILSGQITREDALKVLAVPYLKTVEIEEEKEYFMKKLGYTEGDLDMILSKPVMRHNQYSSDEKLFYNVNKLLNKLYRIKMKCSGIMK